MSLDQIKVSDYGDHITAECSCGWSITKRPADLPHGISLLLATEMASRLHLSTDHAQPMEFVQIREVGNN